LEGCGIQVRIEDIGDKDIAGFGVPDILKVDGIDEELARLDKFFCFSFRWREKSFGNYDLVYAIIQAPGSLSQKKFGNAAP
jgi:hypothetical protein